MVGLAWRLGRLGMGRRRCVGLAVGALVGAALASPYYGYGYGYPYYGGGYGYGYGSGYGYPSSYAYSYPSYGYGYSGSSYPTRTAATPLAPIPMPDPICRTGTGQRGTSIEPTTSGFDGGIDRRQPPTADASRALSASRRAPPVIWA